jgi:hypothetical protein
MFIGASRNLTTGVSSRSRSTPTRVRSPCGPHESQITCATLSDEHVTDRTRGVSFESDRMEEEEVPDEHVRLPCSQSNGPVAVVLCDELSIDNSEDVVRIQFLAHPVAGVLLQLPG